MGIQILNKDVSVISSIAGTPKASIGNLFGKTGWAGGGDVTPNAVNWANIYDPSSQSATVAVQQIQGITSTINLEVSRSGDVFKIYYKIDNSAPAWTNGGPYGTFTSWTEITSFPIVISVSNNQYVSFGCRPGTFLQNATATITVKNNSDSAITLDTFTATVSNEE
jgi:hypothetical protein